MSKPPGRPPSVRDWTERIKEVWANYPTTGRRISPARVRSKLQEKYPNEHPPSERSIRDLMKTIPTDDLLPFEYFRWPESMGDGKDQIPWPGSRAVLDLLRLRCEQHQGPPLLRHALWYWRITQAMPDDDDIEERAFLAAMLAILETSDERDKDDHYQRFQWMLAYRVYQSDENARAYDAAVADGRIPRFTPGFSIASGDRKTIAALQRRLALYGIEMEGMDLRTAKTEHVPAMPMQTAADKKLNKKGEKQSGYKHSRKSKK